MDQLEARLETELETVAAFLGLEVTALEFKQITTDYLSGCCKVNGQHSWLPKFRADDNLRKMVVGYLVGHM